MGYFSQHDVNELLERIKLLEKRVAYLERPRNPEKGRFSGVLSERNSR